MENKIETHRHVLEDGTVIEHTHVEEYGSHHHHDGHGHHGHTHTHEHTKAVLNRLSRAIGHLESIRRTGLYRSSDPALSSAVCHQ